MSRDVKQNRAGSPLKMITFIKYIKIHDHKKLGKHSIKCRGK